MTDLRITAISGTDSIIEEAAVQELRASLHGPLLQPGDESYDEIRKVWNGMINRRPALIARRAGVADVIAAVNLPELTTCLSGGRLAIGGQARSLGNSCLHHIAKEGTERPSRRTPPNNQP